ncbi:MAG: FG-GAP-like repeat-containing protein [Candidatus Aquicultorales bacterium]
MSSVLSSRISARQATAVLLAFLLLLMSAGGLLILPIGKANAGQNEWTSGGPEGGSIYSLDLSPGFPNDGTVFATAEYGLYRSFDRGASWTLIGEGYLERYGPQVWLSPGYASDHTVFGLSGDGKLMKSTDRGDSFTAVSSVPSYAPRLALSPDFVNDQTIFAFGYEAIYKSTNAGAVWTKQDFPGPSYNSLFTLVFSPNYASDGTIFGNSYQGIYKSTDGGATWILLSAPAYGSALAVSPNFANDRTLFLGGWDAIYKSTDAGATWRSVTVGMFIEGTGIAEISPSYATDQTLFVPTGRGVIKSANGGSSWEPVSALTFFRVWSIDLSPGYPSDPTIFAGSLDGVYISEDAGATWAKSNKGINEIRVSSLAISPDIANDGRLYAGSYDGLYVSNDSGDSWSLDDAALPGPHVRSVRFSSDYANDGTVFAVTDDFIYRSTNRGGNWSKVYDPANPPPVQGGGVYGGPYGNNESPYGPSPVYITISPTFATDRTVFVGTYYGLLVSTDGGDSWTAIPLSTYGGIKAVLSPSYATDKTLFAHALRPEADSQKLFKSTDGGKTWLSLSVPFGNYYDGVSSMALSPNYAADKTVYIGTNAGGVMKSTNGGSTWARKNACLWDLNMYSLAIASDGTVFGSTFKGIFKTTNGGASWSPIGDTLARAFELHASPNFGSDKTVYAATDMRGVAEYTIDVTDTVAPQSPSSTQAVALGRTEVSLTWSGASDNEAIDYYVVERKTLDGEYRPIAKVEDTSYKDTGLSPGGPYWYRVWTMDTSGNIANSASAVGYAKTKGSVVNDADANSKSDALALYNYGGKSVGAWAFTTVGSSINALGMTFAPANWNQSNLTLGPDLASSKAISADLNGDGKTDIFGIGPHKYKDGATGSSFWSLESNGSTFTGPQTLFDTKGWDWRKTQMTSGDYDGDGKDEVLAFYAYTNTHTGVFLLERVSDGISMDRIYETPYWDMRKTRLLTVNKGGKATALAAYNYGGTITGLWVFDFDSYGYMGHPNRVFLSNHWDYSRTSFLTGDVNGDSRGDVIAFYDYGGTTTGAFVFKATATSFAYPERAFISNHWDYTRSTFIPGDFTGDDKGDAGVVYDYGGGLTAIWVFKSNGSQLAYPVKVYQTPYWNNPATRWLAPY